MFGLKTLLALGAAWLLRCNPIAAVISVSLHDVVTPLWPFLLRVEYDIGYWILSNPHRLPPHVEMHHLRLAEMLQWTTFLKVGFPCCWGRFSSAPAAAIFYFLTLLYREGAECEGGRLPEIMLAWGLFALAIGAHVSC